MRIVGILLAAGAGTRFGGGKLLAPLRDGTSIGKRSCTVLVEAVGDVIAIVRPGDFELARQLADAGARISECAESVTGMGASVAHGIAQAQHADAVVVALADMPWVSLATIAMINDALSNGASVVVPRYDGRRGNPVGFGSIHFDALRRMQGDRGARDLIESAVDVRWIDVDDPGVVRDVDTVADLHRSGVAADGPA